MNRNGPSKTTAKSRRRPACAAPGTADDCELLLIELEARCARLEKLLRRMGAEALLVAAARSGGPCFDQGRSPRTDQRL